MSDLQSRQGAELGLLLDDLKILIDQARQQVAVAVNVGLTLLYWQVGQRIRKDLLLEEDRAAYGEEIVATLSRQLTQRYGKGFTKSALNRMVQFAEVFPDPQIVATLSQQLSWSHFVLLLPLDKPMQRDYYAEMCRIERWSVRTLSARIDSMLYERTALSRQPDTLIQHELEALRETDHVTPALVFRDPYFLDFLGLDDRYVERDLEDEQRFHCTNRAEALRRMFAHDAVKLTQFLVGKTRIGLAAVSYTHLTLPTSDLV